MDANATLISQVRKLIEAYDRLPGDHPQLKIPNFTSKSKTNINMLLRMRHSLMCAIKDIDPHYSFYNLNLGNMAAIRANYKAYTPVRDAPLRFPDFPKV